MVLALNKPHGLGKTPDHDISRWDHPTFNRGICQFPPISVIILGRKAYDPPYFNLILASRFIPIEFTLKKFRRILLIPVQFAPHSEH